MIIVKIINKRIKNKIKKNISTITMEWKTIPENSRNISGSIMKIVFIRNI